MYIDKLYYVKDSIAREFVNPREKKLRIIPLSCGGKIAHLHSRTSRAIRSSILGTGITFDSQKGPQLKIYYDTESRIDPAIVPSYFGMKETDLVLTRTKPIHLQSVSGVRFRPPHAGISVGHPRGMTGTFGAVVKDHAGVRYMLGNNHVLARSNRGRPGDRIIQPGRLHHGNKDRDVIAHLSDFVFVSHRRANFIDAAIAKLVDQSCHTSMGGYGPITKVAAPEYVKVKKIGSFSGPTDGVVTTTDVDYQVVFDERIVSFNSLIEIQPAEHQHNPRWFSEPGDSGALVIDTEKIAAIGLLFAAGEDEERGYFSLACPIEVVLKQFGVDLV